MDSWKQEYRNKLMSAKEAANLITAGDTIYIGTASTVAYELADALAEREDVPDNVTIASGLTIRPMKIYEDQRFHHMSYFLGTGERTALANGTLRYSSIHLHEWKTWIEKIADINTVFLEVSPPDENGYMNLGTSGAGLAMSIIDHAGKIILSVNKNAARVYGSRNVVHISKADAVVETDTEQGAIPEPEVNEDIRRISELIVEQIPDGATIQLGAGRLGTACGYGLMQKNDLGIHTEMISDSMMRLMQNGNVTNKKKTLYPGKSVIGFAMGSSELYDFLNENEECYFLPLEEVNDPYNIARNDNMISVNGAVEIDLFGQVSSETIRGSHFSGIGGQVDYVRGAQMAEGGKSFIAIESTFGRGDKKGTKIVAHLSPNSVVTTSRADVQYVCTEYGCVNLKNLCMQDRIRAMISLAHPDFRSELEEEAKKNHWI